MSADPYYRARYLPGAIERAERKLAALYAEDSRTPCDVILSDLSFLHRQWEREVQEAQIRNAKADLEYSMGVDHA